MNPVLHDLPRFAAPIDDRSWSGYLTIENVEHVAAAIRRMLVGQQFVWAEYNEGLPGLGLRVDTGRFLTQNRDDPSGVSVTVQDGLASVIVCDTYGVWALHSSLPSQPGWFSEPADKEDARKRKWATTLAFGQSASLQTRALHIEHRVPAGHLARWTVSPTGPVEAT